MDERKIEAEVNDKEESVSLKDNKDTKKVNAKKKKSKKIALENIDLGTKPINISLSKYDFLNYYNLTPNMKMKIKMISIVAVIIIFFIILFILKGKFHGQYDNEINENNNLVINQNIPINSNNASLFNENNNSSNPLGSSSKKDGPP